MDYAILKVDFETTTTTNREDQMKHSIYTIDELHEGAIVEGHEGYSRVKKCVHGNYYYAYMGIDMMEAGIDNNTPVVCVSDDCNYRLDCCN